MKLLEWGTRRRGSKYGKRGREREEKEGGRREGREREREEEEREREGIYTYRSEQLIKSQWLVI